MLFTLVRVLVLVVVLDTTLSEPGCQVWGQSRDQLLPVLDGEVGWLSCPLFSDPSILTSSSNHTLCWSRLSEEDVQEQPITFSRSLVQDRHTLVLLPASTEQAGVYRCTFRNRSVCLQATVRLLVLRPEDVAQTVDCLPAVAAATSQVSIPFQDGRVLECPHMQDATRMASGEPNVTWLYVNPKDCRNSTFWNHNKEPNRTHLIIHNFYERDQGFYYCTVHFQRASRTFRLTRRINVTAVSQSTTPKEPSVLHLSPDAAFPIRTRSPVHLVCTALFPHLDSTWWKMWWTVDGSLPEDCPDRHRFSSTTWQLQNIYGDRTEQSVLVIQDFQAEDLQREFNCSVRNLKGGDTRRAELQQEVSLPSVEVGCGLGAVLLVLLLLFVIYHVFWLELLLIYRSWFGTKERDWDDKDYDVYISYARNSEDECFVLSTLRCVLENTFGYSVCIFDRDSLPGGIVNDDTLTFVARSRRLLVVAGPGYGHLGSQALLELKAGIDNMALGGHLRVILVQYRRVQRQSWVKELRRARLALTLIQWQGDKSKQLTSRFWKQLRLELPTSSASRRQALLMRLHSENSTSSQTGLISNTVR